MWTYSQSSGSLKSPDDEFVAAGYSGHGECKNQPEFQGRHNMGPIPRGFYKIGRHYDSPKVGPYALPLTPFPENEMFGRGDFLMHGDNVDHTASEGCIIMPRKVRELVWASGDTLLEVKL